MIQQKIYFKTTSRCEVQNDEVMKLFDQQKEVLTLKQILLQKTITKR